jgi:hypothetical protein
LLDQAAKSPTPEKNQAAPTNRFCNSEEVTIWWDKSTENNEN